MSLYIDACVCVFVCVCVCVCVYENACVYVCAHRCICMVAFRSSGTLSYKKQIGSFERFSSIPSLSQWWLGLASVKLWNGGCYSSVPAEELAAVQEAQAGFDEQEAEWTEQIHSLVHEVGG